MLKQDKVPELVHLTEKCLFLELEIQLMTLSVLLQKRDHPPLWVVVEFITI